MVCYIVPLVATALIGAGRKAGSRSGGRGSSIGHAAHGLWLNIMMLGGAVFGLIDHMFAGELFAITSMWMTDLAVGGAITAGITACWGVVIAMPKISSSMHSISNRIRM
jgi:hypothetical protein